MDIGRKVVEDRVARPWPERAYRWLLREALTRQRLFSTALSLARLFRRVLPKSLRAKVIEARPAGPLPTRSHSRKVLLLNNCVQPAMLPSIDAATMRVLDAVGVQSIITPGSGCCGAIRHHMNDHAGALEQCRRNIHAWWPLIEAGEVEAIVVNASGCGVMVKEYGHLLRKDPGYAAKARRVAELTRDPAEFLAESLVQMTRTRAALPARRVAFHPPCTLQHGLKIRGKVEGLLQALGAELVPVRDSHLCCGSAGTYSILQPQLSRELQGRKLQSLLEHQPEAVLSANVGCIAHLQGGTSVPVRHWIEWVDEVLAAAQS